MDYPHITAQFEFQAGLNRAMARDFKKDATADADTLLLLTSGHALVFSISQETFLLDLKRFCSALSPQQIREQLDLVDRMDLYRVLRVAAGQEGFKDVPKLHTALLLYTTKGLSEEDALARTAAASDDEILNPQRLVLNYLRTLLPESYPQRLSEQIPR